MHKSCRFILLRLSAVNSILRTCEFSGVTNPPLSVTLGNGTVTFASSIIPRVSLTVMFISAMYELLAITVNDSKFNVDLFKVSSNVRMSMPVFMSISKACRYGGVVSAV